MIYECDRCQAALPPNKTQCPKCGERFDEPVPDDAEVPVGFTAKAVVTPTLSHLKVGLDVKQIIALAGVALVFVGAFAPIVSMPVVGGINYFQNGKGDGTIIIGLALFSAILALTRRYVGLWLTGAATLGLLTFTYLSLQAHLSGTQDALGTELANNPFKGLSDMMLQSVQIQWGWSLLIIGALLILGAAALRSETKSCDSPPQSNNRIVPVLSAALLILSVSGSIIYTQHEKAQIVDEAKAKVAQEAQVQDQQQAAEHQAQATQEQATQAEDQAKQNALNELTLETWSWASTDFSRALIGTIRNNSNRTIDYVSVNFNLLDTGGSKVGTSEDTIANLGPGESWKFKAIVFQDTARRASLDAIKGTVEAGPVASSPIVPEAPAALPASELPVKTWPVPQKIPAYLPGKSLDKVTLGQSRDLLLTAVGRKPNSSTQFKDGSSEDNWTTNYRDKSGKFDDTLTISALYRQNQVIQVEFDTSDDGPKLPSFNKLISENKRLVEVCYGVDDYDDKGQPAGGYVQFYYDDVQQGIAYGATTQDDFILTRSPDSIIIHSPNSTVSNEVADAKVTLETGHEATVYKTQAEADKADNVEIQSMRRKVNSDH